MIHRKKNRPALHRRDILTISLASFYFFKIFFYSKFAELFFHPILSGSVLFSILHSSVLFKTLCLGLFVRSLSTQLVFLVVLLVLLLSMTAFSSVGLLSLF